MAIGTAAAIGMGLAAGGSILSAKSNRKAASKAADVSEANNTRNIALQREIYGQNQQALSPFMQRGNAAGDQLNAMLLGAPAQQQPAQPAPNALAQFGGGRMNAAAPYGLQDGVNIDQRDMWMRGNVAQAPNEYWQSRMNQGGNINVATPGTAGPANTTIGAPQTDPFATFRNSTGYQFRLGEAMDQVNSGYAGAGVLQSGAAMKAIAQRAGQEADNTFGQYAGLLQGQQAVGAGAASALAGVGQNFANSVTASNNMNAANQANALLVRGQNSFGNTLGMMGGVLTGLGG